MASTPDNHSDYPHLNSHTATWATFCTISKWVVIASVVSLALMAAFLTGDHRSVGP
jgi:Bacterial aa3 type cytochrome c oxidase subunit IV